MRYRGKGGGGDSAGFSARPGLGRPKTEWGGPRWRSSRKRGHGLLHLKFGQGECHCSALLDSQCTTNMGKLKSASTLHDGNKDWYPLTHFSHPLTKYTSDTTLTTKVDGRTGVGCG